MNEKRKGETSFKKRQRMNDIVSMGTLAVPVFFDIPMRRIVSSTCMYVSIKNRIHGDFSSRKNSEKSINNRYILFPFSLRCQSKGCYIVVINK